MWVLAALFYLTLILTSEGKSNVLIIVTNPEPKSFCMAIKDTCVETLKKAGHEVKVTDIYDLKMFNRIDKTDFTELYDKTYFRPQVEQGVANEKNGTTFVEEIRRERDKVIWANIIIYVFPIYMHHSPGIFQSYLERVFSYGFAFGPRNLTGKSIMRIMTAGATEKYLEKILKRMTIMQDILNQLNALKELKPYVCYQVKAVTDAKRKEYLKEIAERMQNIEQLPLIN